MIPEISYVCVARGPGLSCARDAQGFGAGGRGAVVMDSAFGRGQLLVVVAFLDPISCSAVLVANSCTLFQGSGRGDEFGSTMSTRGLSSIA